MWANSQKLVVWLAAETWKHLHYYRSDRLGANALASKEAHAVLDPFWRLFDFWSDVAKSQRVMSPPANYRDGLSRLLSKVVGRMEKRKQYELFPQLWVVIIDYNRYFGTALSAEPELVAILVTAINMMAGTESKVLAGTRGNRPAWKPLRPPIRTQSDLEAVSRYGVADLMAYLEQDDVEMIPDWPLDLRGSILGVLSRTPRPFDTQSLLEDAYYNQRYALGARGAYIQLRGFGPLAGMTLKTKPGLRDPNYVDFLVRFELDLHVLYPERYPAREVRESFMVIDGQFASGEMSASGASKMTYQYLASVVALVYHDLVTADDAVAAHGVARRRGMSARAVSREGQSWTYLPAKVGAGYGPIRTPLAEPRCGQPHHVRGHRRKRPLSPQHREVLRRFEAETGLRILEVLESRYPGYTFVRPHVVPAGSDARLAQLPRFIHRRLQDELDQALSETAVE